MCEIHAYLLRGEREELIVQNVEAVESAGEEIKIRDIYGQQYRLTAEIRGVDMLDGRILLVENFSKKCLPVVHCDNLTPGESAAAGHRG